jgi:hypothetical protein
MPTISDKRWVEDLDLRAAFSRAVADAVNSPKPTLAAAIGEWPHDDVAGTDHRSIAGSDLAAAAPYANARDLDLLDPTGRNWVAGLAAATNPSFSAQLVAADAGVSLAALCPDSENGTARLAAFEVGSDLAAVQVGRIPGVTPPGWSLLRITGPVNSLRSIRFDPGEHGAIVDVGHFSITLRTDLVLDPERRTLDDLTDPRLVWVTSHPIDTHHFAHRSGGHLIVPIDPAIAGHVRSVDVTVGFRSWLLDRDESLAETPVAQQVTAHTRRVIDGVKRRFGP